MVNPRYIMLPALMAGLASLIALPVRAMHGPEHDARIKVIEELPSAGSAHPSIVEVIRGDPAKASAPAKADQKSFFTYDSARVAITAGEKVWFVDRKSGAVKACSFVRGMYVGQRNIRCWGR